MVSAARAKAEQRFAKIQKREDEVRNEHQIAQQERQDKIEKLKALRLAKEAADRAAQGTITARQRADEG